jgi:hypothetical protein
VRPTTPKYSVSAAAAFTMPGVEVKGAFVSAYHAALKKLGLLDGVLKQASPEVREALQRPPPASVWVDYGLIVEVCAIVQSLGGKNLVRRMAREATMGGIAPVMQALVQGMLRLFGVSPATLFGNMHRVSSQTTRGGEFAWTRTSECSGVMTMRVPRLRGIDPALWYASAGGLEVVFDACHVNGTIQEPVAKEDESGTIVEYRISWRPIDA